MSLPRKVYIPTVVLFCICLIQAFMLTGHIRIDEPWIFQHANGQRTKKSSIRSKQPTSSCDLYRSYPWPAHHTGLPYLGDVFASTDSEFVNFVAIHRGACKEEYKAVDHFAADGAATHRFLCVFPEHTIVLSETVHPSSPHDNGFIIRCRIPHRFQELVVKGQEMTSLHVDLYGIDDLELRRQPSMDLSELPKLRALPVCHPGHLAQHQYNLTAFTRIKSEYALSHHIAQQNESKTSPLSRLMEWIDYHKMQGFDHFVIYDNDEKPHGPLERMLAPLVENGSVTYRWFPLNDCWVDHGPFKDYLSAWGQMVASLSALHRLGAAGTKYFAHMDVDEFFVPLSNGKSTTVLDMIEAHSSDTDAFLFIPTKMAPCNGTQVHANQSVLEKWKCLTGQHYADIKIIMRSERMLYFFIHYPILTKNWTRPVELLFNDTTEGFLAHYREDNEPNSQQRDSYIGMVQNQYTNNVPYMDEFLKKSRAKKQNPRTEQNE